MRQRLVGFVIFVMSWANWDILHSCRLLGSLLHCTLPTTPPFLRLPFLRLGMQQ